MSNLQCLQVSIPRLLDKFFPDVSICRSHEEEKEVEDEPHFQSTRVIHSSKGRGHGQSTEIPSPTYCSACRSRQLLVLSPCLLISLCKLRSVWIMYPPCDRVNGITLACLYYSVP
jgi:hypothetical protein